MSNNFIVYLLLFFIIVTFTYGLYKAKIKGVVGEKTVASILSFLSSSQYEVINNVVLNIHGRTSQIDHIVVSDFGVFVIETKNYKGWIMGGENSEYWTQVLYKRKEKLYNPIRQNLGHIRALKNSLSEFAHVKYISIIVFSSQAELKVNTTTEVTDTFKLLEVIRKHTEINLSENQKQKIIEKINSINSKDKYDKSQHINSIKQRVQNREESISQNKCPQCGEGLVLRQGRFGNFLGCQNFPQCKFTRNI